MPGSLKITNIQFTTGASAGAAPLVLHPNNVVIFVGPNNSGKSMALREIESACSGSPFPNLIVQDVAIDLPNDAATIDALARAFKIIPPKGNSDTAEFFWIGQYTLYGGQEQGTINVAQLLDSINANPNAPSNKALLGKYYTVRLDGRTRFSLAEPKPSGDLLEIPKNHLWRLFKDDAARAEVRRLTADAFGLHFVIDPTGMTEFKIRMSSRAPVNNAEEQALDNTSRNFHAAAQEIQKLSDGVQAFVGLTSALVSLPHKILLIDEPEAFLHPPLARRLGSNLASLTNGRDATLITATHSADFVMGCLETVANTVVVRFTYEGGVATSRLLSDVDLQTMIKDPLLRSTGTLRALFHRGAIVTESDTDRAFYDEINNRLLQVGRGIKDSLFINAQNKQTIRRIVKPLRQIGVPAAGLVDLDIIRVQDDLENLMRDCNVPTGDRAAFQIERAWLFPLINAIVLPGGLDPLKKGGISLLGGADLARAEQFLDNLGSYGIFPVPIGEVERWLLGIGATGKGAAWLLDIFSRIGQTPADPAYLVPAANDVWEFINKIETWIQNPARLGV